MEHTGTFDLEKEIENYSLSINAALSDSDRLELVDHFRNETDDLMQKGLSQEEAFIISRFRFGDRQMIQDEFRKTKPVFTLHQVVLKSVFLGVSFVMILSLSHYISFLSSGWFSQIFEPTSTFFAAADLLMKGSFIGLSLFGINILLRKEHLNSEIYIIILMIYLLLFVVMYFLSGQLPAFDPTLGTLLVKNTIWVNVVSLVSLIIYNLYLASMEANLNVTET
jgi:hypothetical protein